MMSAPLIEEGELTDEQIHALAVLYSECGDVVVAGSLDLAAKLELLQIEGPAAVLIGKFRELLDPHIYRGKSVEETLSGQPRAVMALLAVHFTNRRNLVVASLRATMSALSKHCGMTGETRELLERFEADIALVMHRADLEVGRIIGQPLPPAH